MSATVSAHKPELSYPLTGSFRTFSNMSTRPSPNRIGSLAVCYCVVG